MDDPEHNSKMDLLIVSRMLDEERTTSLQPMFCQMNRLTDTGCEVVWMETARWIKFEEFLDEDANRWSKPHVPSLSLRALTTLRRELRHVPLFLDPEVTDFNSLIEKLASSWFQCGLIDKTLEDGIKGALHRPHRHVHEGKLSRPVSAGSNLLSVRELGLGGSSVSLQSMESYASEKGPDVSDMNSNEDISNRGSPKVARKNTKFRRKIPKNAVATNILIGEVAGLKRPLMAFVRLGPPRHLGWICEVRLPTEFLFVYLVPDGSKSEQRHDVKEVGRCVGTLMIDPIFREIAERCTCRFELLAGITEFMNNLTALPSFVWDPSTRLEPPSVIPSQEFRRAVKKNPEERQKHVETTIQETEEPELRRSGRLFGGLIADVKRKLHWYWSDFKDSLHVQCVASTIFLFLATLTPNVTFGGLLGQETDQYMGTMECILAAAICGVVFALFSGQPMNILGSTGPMLVLEMIIYEYCRDNDWDFLSFRVWIGLWTTSILLVIVAFDLSSLVQFITRFTEECFASLIALIFIYEAFAKVIKINSNYPVHFGSSVNIPVCSLLNWTSDDEDGGNMSQILSLMNMTSLLTNRLASNSTGSLVDINNATLMPWASNSTSKVPVKCHSYVGDVFFLSVLEFLFTFGIAIVLVRLKSTIYFPSVLRQTVSDFAVLIAIVIVVGLDAILGIDTPKLIVPDKFSPTRPDRDWLISPISNKNPWWLAIAACLPAMLATILVFMDQQITAVIVNRKENKLKKGCGYHLDILVLAVLISVMSFLGLPWYVAATVSALAHMMSLKVESDCAAPGEKPTFLGVREQRVTSLLVGLLSGFSVLLTSVLKLIPLPVLYGVFLFMGIRSLEGMQLVDRFLLYLVSPKYQPDYPYLRHVPIMRVHLYTLIQVLCLAGLWIIKTFKETSIGFPIMVLATCFIRKLLDCVFTQYELSWLDNILPPISFKKTKVTLDEIVAVEFTRRKLSLVVKPASTGSPPRSPFPKREPPMKMKMKMDVEAHLHEFLNNGKM